MSYFFRIKPNLVNTPNNRLIHSNHPVFSNPYLVFVDAEHIRFWNPGSLYNGKVRSPSKKKNGAIHTAVVEEIPVGYFSISEESTNEELVIYFADMLNEPEPENTTDQKGT